MKKLLLSVAVVALSAGSAFAADLPSRKAPPLPPPPPPPPLWTGFHAGLNAGFGFGTNDPVYSQNYGVGTNDHEGASRVDAAPLSRSVGMGYGPRFDGLLGAQTAALATSGMASLTQSGFVGGGQIGYDYQYGNFVFGIEADIQGSGIRGTSHTIGAASSNGSFFNGYGSENWNAVGVSSVNAGVDWFGTVRGRVGYLWTPTMLVYGTGGLTYGGVYANVNSAAFAGVSQSFGGCSGITICTFDGLGGRGGIAANYTFIGGGNKSQTLVGWNAGGGIEWMFMPNWSLKAEALYWNMGSMNVPTASFATAPFANGSPMASIGMTRVNYQGVIARAGINYHFNWFTPPVVAAY